VKARLAPLLLLAFAGIAGAVETTQWPPPRADEARMRELQQALSKRDSTPEQREAARKELGRMLMSPAAGSVPSAVEESRRPARAAIDPFPSIPAPPTPPRVPTPGVAELEVVSPPKPMVIPDTGSVATPSGRILVDPRTGSVLHETPTGYVDPRTGRLTPK
jgi:hypothetical protein